MMDRRTFLCGLTGAVTLSAQASAEPPARRIGLLMTTTPVAASHIAAAFAEGLRDLGYVEGKDVVFEYLWAEGKPERLAEMAAQLVRHKVYVIVASSQAPAPPAFSRRAAPIAVTPRCWRTRSPPRLGPWSTPSPPRPTLSAVCDW